VNKGQIYSLDFIIATVLVVICIGAMLNLYETKNQEIALKENQKTLETKLITAKEIILGSSNFNCDLNGIILSQTIDKNKIINASELKAKLGLQDVNTQISITSNRETTYILNDVVSGGDIYSIDSNIMICESSTKLNFSIINDCFDGKCYNKNFTEGKIQIRVSK